MAVCVDEGLDAQLDAQLDDQIVSLDDLLSALGELERLTAKVALAAAGLAASGVWAVDGSLPMASWLEHHHPISHRDALSLLRHGKFLASFPAVADAAVTGAVSASQVAA